jgi:2-succinyl-6-hydroxy-2,4-cyclohexadiene-1-carboxylate synthase
VALHGFTLTGASFAELAASLPAPLQAPDLPGHGRTTISPVEMATTVAALGDYLASLPRSPVLLGYSQGARIAIQVALHHADLVGSLALVSASPGLPERERQPRRVADAALATRIEQIGTARFIGEWLANPLTSTAGVDPDVRARDYALRLENSAAGLAAALRGLGQATVPYCGDQLTDLPIPVMFIAGANDTRYAGLARTMAARRGTRAEIVRGAGHNLILEDPGAVAAAVRRLLEP